MTDNLPIFTSLLSALWRASWQGGLVILLVLAVTHWWRRMPPLLRVWLWRIAYLKLLLTVICCGAITVPAPVRLPDQFPALAWYANLESPARNAGGSSVIPAPMGSNNGVRTAFTAPSHALPVRRWHELLVSIQPYTIACLCLLWLVGVIWVCGNLARAWWQTLSLRRSCTPVKDDRIPAMLVELAHAAGVRRVPEVLSSTCEGPLLLGMFNPAIIIPAKLLAVNDPGALRLMLAHELAHIRRHDLAWGWVAALAECLFFFHPLVRLGNREWELAQEIACDALVVHTTAAARADYGAMLTDTAAYSVEHAQPTLLAVGVSESFQTLQRRLQAMKERTHFSRKQLALIGALVALLLALIVIPWRMAAGQTTTVTPQAAQPGNSPMIWHLNDMKVSPDGKHIAVASWRSPDNGIRPVRQPSTQDELEHTLSCYAVYNLETGNIEQQFSIAKCCPWLARFTPDSRYIPITTDSGTNWERLDINTGQRTKLNVNSPLWRGVTQDGTGYWVDEYPQTQMTFPLPPQNQFTLLALHNIATGKVLRRLPLLAGEFRAISDDDSTVVTLNYDETPGVVPLMVYHCYDARTGHELSSYSEGKGRKSFFTSMSRDGSRIALYSYRIVDHQGLDRKDTVWDSHTGKVINTLIDVGGLATLNPAGTLLAVNNADGVLLWQVDTGAIMYTLPRAQVGFNQVTFTPDGTRIITAGTGENDQHDLPIKVWDVQSGDLLKTIDIGLDDLDGNT